MPDDTLGLRRLTRTLLDLLILAAAIGLAAYIFAAVILEYFSSRTPLPQ